MPGAWAYARVESSAAAARRALPDIIGKDGARLVLKGSGEPVGPPDGAVRIHGRWAVGRSSGEAEVLLFPLSGALCEVHVTLHPDGYLPRRAAKLTRLATDLAHAIADAVKPSGLDQERVERRTATGSWVFMPATGTRSH